MEEIEIILLIGLTFVLVGILVRGKKKNVNEFSYERWVNKSNIQLKDFNHSEIEKQIEMIHDTFILWNEIYNGDMYKAFNTLLKDPSETSFYQTLKPKYCVLNPDKVKIGHDGLPGFFVFKYDKFRFMFDILQPENISFFDVEHETY